MLAKRAGASKHSTVIPAKAGIQSPSKRLSLAELVTNAGENFALDPRLRGDDNIGVLITH